LQSIISELGETATVLGAELRDAPRSLDGRHELSRRSAELDRIRRRLAELQAEASAIVER